MKVSEVMSRDVKLAAPGDTIGAIAQRMASGDTGCVPVGENDRLVGMITDRDIAVRAVAVGKGPDTPVREVMSGEVRYCYEDETLTAVAKNMADIKVRRLPVMSRAKRLVGMVALADLAAHEPRSALKAMTGASSPGGPHDR